MSEEEIREKLSYYLELPDTHPSIIQYTDTLWKRGFFKFHSVPLPGDREYGKWHDLSEPTIKCRIGNIVTRDGYGNEFVGIGVIAANLYEPETDKLEKLQLIFHADPNAAGVVFVGKKGNVLGWIDREDATQV